MMKVLCEEPKRGRPPNGEIKGIKDTLKAFDEVRYKPHLAGQFNYRHMNIVLDYRTIDVIKMHDDYIKQRFVEYVERFFNVSCEKKALIAAIKKHKKTTTYNRATVNALCAHMWKMKTGMLNPGHPKTAHSLYHVLIDKQFCNVLP